ncbi:MAG: 6,7-dimethyl-8-ribityllumazine synthase [Dehalococcoidia bacterium]
MARVLAGRMNGEGLRVGVVVARFNEFVTAPLLDGALDTLRRHGVEEDRIDVAWTPGSYEIPMVAKRMAESGRYDAVICLGAVIRGQTPHFDYVSANMASGIFRAGYETGVPVIFAVLTTNTVEEAIDRAGAKAGNKGRDAASAAVEMADLMRQIRGG